ncbi:MAG TPA: FMN-binding negative transcriptional regulator, partial [Sphingomicrobium sp.]|nr:FMN-binding negative transcriptional regulator [Sphingomicrobium sp.]
MSPFLPRDPADVNKLVEAYPLCWIVSERGAERYATPLPLLPEHDDQGVVKSLFGHIARSNPQAQALEDCPGATILCMGPQGY